MRHERFADLRALQVYILLLLLLSSTGGILCNTSTEGGVTNPSLDFHY